jgi:hypothetical protein
MFALPAPTTKAGGGGSVLSAVPSGLFYECAMNAKLVRGLASTASGVIAAIRGERAFLDLRQNERRAPAIDCMNNPPVIRSAR